MPHRRDISWEELTSVAILPTVGLIFNHISSMLMRCNFKIVGLSPRKVTSFLWPVKGDLGLKTAGIYSIPVYVTRSTLDKPRVPLRSGSRSTISMLGCIIQTNQLWMRQHKPGSPYPFSRHHDPGYEIQMHGTHHWQKNRDWNPFWKHEQVMKVTTANPEWTKEGPFL